MHNHKKKWPKKTETGKRQRRDCSVAFKLGLQCNFFYYRPGFVGSIGLKIPERINRDFSSRNDPILVQCCELSSKPAPVLAFHKSLKSYTHTTREHFFFYWGCTRLSLAVQTIQSNHTWSDLRRYSLYRSGFVSTTWERFARHYTTSDKMKLFEIRFVVVLTIERCLLQ